MKEDRIDIVVPDEVLAENDAKIHRLEAAHRLERPDRVPVLAGGNQFMNLTARNRTFAQYIRSPEDNLREQILSWKWQIENIRDDAPIPTKSLTFRPDLGCLRGTEFPMEIVWQEDGPPKCVHPLQSLEDVDRLSVPPPDGGLNARYIEWHGLMTRAAERLDVRLNGKPLRIEVTLSQGGGPIPAAFALAGVNLFLWVLEDPARTRRLMDVVTQSHLNCIRHYDALVGRDTAHPIWMGCDTGEMLSPAMFREFVVPYYLRVWEQYPGPPRAFHMCGQINHLLTILRDELRITKLDGFGSVTDRGKLADEMSGRLVLQGGPEPLLIFRGNRDEIVRECVSYIRTVGRSGGYILCPGGGAVPGTPTDHFAWMVEASERAAE
ncbi:MAG TPA: uroporphyrinogen decarboxylase family protein [Planctomycetota bacterium]|nr:uroporphyrinogen decarboxylase family protein [Planctomycetota bacterium]